MARKADEPDWGVDVEKPGDGIGQTMTPMGDAESSAQSRGKYRHPEPELPTGVEQLITEPEVGGGKLLYMLTQADLDRLAELDEAELDGEGVVDWIMHTAVRVQQMKIRTVLDISREGADGS